MTHKERRALIDPRHPELTITKQAALLDISRSSVYYTPIIKPEDVLAMKAIDAIYTKCPFYGSRRIKWDLQDYHGIYICRDQVRRLMRQIGLQVIYPKSNKNLSKSHPDHQIYPYLLRNIQATHPNHIWGTDITFIRLETGWAYLVALLDWYSRYVISWKLSPSLETDFCIEALAEALGMATPEIHNSDQGSQFTSEAYITKLKFQGIQISMDGRGRYLDNIFTERLWRTVKYENVYLHSYQDINEARQGLTEYFRFYNTERRHQSLNDQTPAKMYFSQKTKKFQFQQKNNALQCV